MALNALIELRIYQRRLTLDDVRSGVTPQCVRVGPTAVEAYHPERVLQYRSRVKVDGKLEWSDWQDAPLVREEPSLTEREDAMVAAHGPA